MNLLSLLLGIASILFAVHSVQVRGCLACCTLNGIFCSAALLCQLVDNARLLDAAAMLDTAHARAVCACILLVTCSVLNTAALIRSRNQKKCNHC